MTTGIDLVPIAGPEAEGLVKSYSFFANDEIPDDAYKNTTGVKTVSVNAHLGDLDQAARGADLCHHGGAVEPQHPQAARFGPFQGQGRSGSETSQAALGIPLHPGAEKFYKEKGLIK